MARPKRQLNRREDVLNAAKEIFTQKGYEKATVDEIAAEAGISKGSVYLEFKNKYEIYLAIVIEHCVQLLDEYEELSNNATAPYLDSLKQMFIIHTVPLFDCYLNKDESHLASIHTSYKVKRDVHQYIERGLNSTMSVLKKAVGNGEMKPLNDYKAMAVLIDVMMSGFYPPYDMKYSREYNPDLSAEELKTIFEKDFSTVVDIILSGLKSGTFQQ